MPKRAKELSARELQRISDAGFYAVGGVSGLHLQVTKSGAKSWILRVTTGEERISSTGKPYFARQDIGLGSYPDISLAKARERAREAKDKIRQGINPVAERKAIRSAMLAERAKAVTFADLSKEYVAKKAKDFKEGVARVKQVQRLEHYLTAYAFPFIGNMVIADIERAHIVKMLEPIWDTKTETASRVRLNVERILDLAGVKGLRSGDNPARWKGNLDHTFAARHKIAKVQHYTALPVDDMPAFWDKVKEQKGMGARALEYLILTACRSGEVRGATWDEIDLKRRTWTIPADRMKAGREHRVPLSDAAIAILEALPRESQFVFYNSKGGPLSDVTISKVPKTAGYQVTAHGFRSTFKDWCGDHTAYPDEISELALAHVNSDKTRVAYARSDAFEKRRRLMQEWEQYCLTGETEVHSADVVAIGGQKG